MPDMSGASTVWSSGCPGSSSIRRCARWWPERERRNAGSPSRRSRQSQVTTEETAMTIADDRSHAAGNCVVGWWRRWRQRAASLAELDLLAGETDRVARDAGVDVGDLRVLAGKWPDAADLAE